MLELDDIQHITLTRVPAVTGRYEFLYFRNPTQGRAWLSGLLDKVASTREARASVKTERRWVSVAFTWAGLGALGVSETSLATFPEEFRQGMVARAEVLGDTGLNHPSQWIGELASPRLHATVILFARDVDERRRVVREHRAHLEQTPGVELLSSLDLDATPPLRLRT